MMAPLCNRAIRAVLAANEAWQTGQVPSIRAGPGQLKRVVTAALPPYSSHYGLIGLEVTRCGCFSASSRRFSAGAL